MVNGAENPSIENQKFVAWRIAFCSFSSQVLNFVEKDFVLSYLKQNKNEFN